MNLLKELCEIRSTSGDEEKIKNYLINYINTNKKKCYRWSSRIFIDDAEFKNRSNRSKQLQDC